MKIVKILVGGFLGFMFMGPIGLVGCAILGALV
jgi:hypothetical protein